MNGAFATGGNKLIAELEDARAKLDRGVDLLQLAIDLQEQLWWSLDLDDAVAEVAALKRAVEAHRR